jgi:hypothetical protein
VEVHAAEPLVSGHSPVAEIAVAKLTESTSPTSDQILAQAIQAGGEMLLSQIHKLNNYIWNKEELPDLWKESIIVPVHKKGNKTDCNYYRWISLLSTSYKLLSNILLSRLIPDINETIGDHQCEF